MSTFHAIKYECDRFGTIRWSRIAPPLTALRQPNEGTLPSESIHVPMPEMGDTRALADVVERTEKMAEAMVPLVTEYFERRQTGDT